jgi:hypothetical protein
VTEQRQSVTLAPGESKQVTFTTVPLEPGHYSVTVNGLSGSFDVVEISGQTLWGHVNVAGAVIEIGGQRVYSDESGNYSIPGIAPGVYDVSISAPGYQEQVHHISVIPGDATCDGIINMLDVTKVERIISGLDPWTPSADANQDGYVNMADITKIERIIMGYDQPLTTMRFDVALEPVSALYSLSGGTWDAAMPFAVNSRHFFTMTFTNVSGRCYDYLLEMTFPGSGSTRQGSTRPGYSVGLSSYWYMPYTPGIYELVLSITIDGQFIESIVVSQVEVI